ncbi:MAG: histidine kinase dimerization/phosphoacceptor domain -containing protein [Bryobacteraceae bacterium]
MDEGFAGGLCSRQDPLARIFELADDAIISVDREQRIVLFNQGAERIFGYTTAEVMGQLLDMLLPSRLTNVHRAHIATFESSTTNSRKMGDRNEILGRRKDGAEFPAEASISKIAVGAEMMFTVILRDVTSRVRADEQLKASLREKEVLLKEIHHRVKNNLQVVSSLLGLQARSIEDQLTRKKFEESQNRIHSMALLHECLYQSENLAKIHFTGYIQQLAEYLFRSYGEISDRIHLNVDLDSLYLDMDTAVPCGLIINELISNSLKYGFPNGREGRIMIQLRGIGDRMSSLSVGDDGIGLNDSVDWTATKSLGLRLVRTLSRQLGAEVVLEPGPGTHFRVIFASEF